MLTLNKDRIDKARVNWTPTQFEANTGTASSAVKRFVNLRRLECSVFEFIKAIAKDNPEVADILLRNCADESNHLLQLDYLAAHLELKDNDDYKEFDNALVSCTSDADIVKAFCLEQVVFMCILPEFCRESNVNVSSVATWILRDEAIHVNVNRSLMQQLGLTPSSELIKVCLSILNYVLLGYPLSYKKMMFERAKKLLKSGFNGVASEVTHVIPASVNFFEVTRNIKY